MIGTIINVIAIVIGTIVGMILKSKLPDRITSTIFQGIGLFTIFLGISMALKTNNFFLLILSIVIGSLIGSIFFQVSSWVPNLTPISSNGDGPPGLPTELDKLYTIIWRLYIKRAE